MSGLEGLVRSERLALIDLLVTLTPDEWDAPSLCEGWRVRDVAAHVAWMPVFKARQAPAELARSRFRMNALIAEYSIRMAGRGTDATIEQLRINAESGVKPIGVPRSAALADAVVHQLDIRRPLGRSRTIPEPAYAATADFFLGQRWPMTIPIGGSPSKRVEGVRLVATDVAWTHGDGPEARGSAETLLLMVSGRRIGPDELTGPGAGRVHDRTSAT